LLLLWQACGKQVPPQGALVFERAGQPPVRLELAELVARIPPRVVHTQDPYYGGEKRFRALPLTDLLAFAYGEPLEVLRTRAFMLEALDGYRVPVEGHVLLDGAAFVAIDDVDIPGFAPIGPRKVSPAPAYVIW
jgi:hypothetical protein